MGLSSDHKDRKKNLMLMLPMLHQGGFERVAVATARLLKDDFHITVCIFNNRDIHYDVTGLDVVNLDVPASRGRFKKIYNVARRVIRARRLKKERNIDISYSFGNTANLVNVLSGAGERVITGFRCGTDLNDKKIVMLCRSGSDMLLSCSREIEALLKRDFGCLNTGFVYNPLDVAGISGQAAERHTREPEENKNFTIVTMGRDDVIKAHWHMIKAFYHVTRVHSEARLKIIGAGRYERAKELVKQLGIDDKVEFTGALKNPFPEVAAAGLYVLPSNNEGFPNALAEAMALGLPVIATDCRSGPREILLSDSELEALLDKVPWGASTDEVIDGAFGVLVPDMSSAEDYSPNLGDQGEKALAAEIIKMIEDAERREYYASQALKRAESFTPENYRRELLKILRSH